MADFEVVLGLNEVVKRLEQLPERFAMNLIRRSLRAGGVPLLEFARQAAAVKYGNLRDSLELVTDRRGAARTELVVRVRVSPARRGQVGKGELPPRSRAHLVEFGTRWRRQGKGSNPGVRPRPFMGSAFEARKEEALAAVKDRFRREMLKAGRLY